MTAPRTVAICGSCITRDSFNARFNPDHRRWYDVRVQANQSSMIALMSPPITPEITEADGLNAYDAWNVASDLDRSFLTELAADPPDYLIVDFFGDVHFGVLQLPDGRYATDNAWKLHQTAQYRAWTEGTQGPLTRMRLLEDTQRYYRAWTEAMDRFAGYVAEHCPRTRVIVHRGFYADKVVDGPFDRPRSLRKHARLARLKVGRLNDLWARLDDYAVSLGWDGIDLRGEGWTSTADHPWGAFWVHYSPDYYHRFLAELHAIDLTARHAVDAPDVAAQVALIAAAGRERIAAQEEFLRVALKAQTKVVSGLEGQSVLNAGRTAVARQRLGGRAKDPR